MYQLNLFQSDNYLPDALVELQYQWVKAIQNRQQYETKPDYYEMTDGILQSVYLSDDYHKARRKEMMYFDMLCDFAHEFPVFQGVHDYLYV